MDNLCHTLVGAALADTGLRRRTALGAATLMIGANFPDIDIIAVPLNVGLQARRGVTHGFAALIVLPFVLTGLILLWHRVVRRGRVSDPALPVRPLQVLLLAFVSMVTHPVLDWMNTYGMRWLMPFSDRWFYADGLFIVDPWMVALLASGVIAGRRRWGRQDPTWRRPARIAVGATAAYVLAMVSLTAIGRRAVAERLVRDGFAPDTRYMVAPVPVNAFARSILVETDGAYRFATLHFVPRPRFAWSEGALPKHDRDPAVIAVRRTPQGAAFLRWSRFPFYQVDRGPSGTVVSIGDARYTFDATSSWASVQVRLPTAIAAADSLAAPR